MMNDNKMTRITRRPGFLKSKLKRTSINSSRLGNILAEDYDSSSTSELDRSAPIKKKRSNNLKSLSWEPKNQKHIIDRSKSPFYHKLDNLTQKVKEYVRMFGTNDNLK